LLREGESAPDFTLTSDSGETVSLSDFRGKPVLYFYPKERSTTAGPKAATPNERASARPQADRQPGVGALRA